MNKMKITVFSSGSSGNCSLLQTEHLNILIDVGITKKNIEQNLIEYSLTLNNIDAIFITHEHIDHIKAFNSLLKYENAKIYMTYGTYKFILDNNEVKNAKLFELMRKRKDDGSIIILNRLSNTIFYESVSLFNLKVDVLPTFHDASESVGFVFEEGQKKLVYITDTGYVHQSLYDRISNADAYVLESNHDPSILMHSSRPYALKLRIISNHGHLSNEDSMVTLAHIIGPKTKLVMHAHISQECNLTNIIELTRKKVLDDYGIDYSQIEFVFTSVNPSKEYEI